METSKIHTRESSNMVKVAIAETKAHSSIQNIKRAGRGRIKESPWEDHCAGED